jgi:hypothetical protein
MPRGGSRKHPADCKCGNCPKLGRKKQERLVDGNFARQLKAKAKAEEKWLRAFQLACEKAERTGNTADMVRILSYWDDRDLGRCVDTVNHLHDKPIEHTVNVTFFEAIERARKRVAQ